MSQLPEDVWFRIARLLTVETRRKIFGLNRVFFQLGIKDRYETATFARSDGQTKRLCAQLREDYIRYHVRRVVIQPWLVQPRTKSYHSLKENLWNRLSSVVDPDYLLIQAEQRLQTRLSNVINLFNATAPALTGVKEYEIHWNESKRYHPELYKAFLAPLLGTWKGLEKLTLKIPPEMLSSLNQVRLPKLLSLEINLYTGDWSTVDINNEFDGFLVFIHNLKDTLKSITISSTSSSAHLNFVYFFTHLGRFPHLERFNFSIPFEGAQLPSTVSLQNFLESHRSSLRHLSLTTSRCGSHGGPTNPEWIQAILSSVHFPYLRSVELALRPVKADLVPISQFLGLHSTTLHSVALSDRELSCSQVDDLIDGLGTSPAVSELRLRVRYLSLDLLNSLALKLPQLEILALAFSDIVVTDGFGQTAVSKREEFNQFCKQMRQSRLNFSDWHLRTFAILQGPRNFQWLPDLEAPFAHCIPTCEIIPDPSP